MGVPTYLCSKICRSIHNKKIEIKLKSYMECCTHITHTYKLVAPSAIARAHSLSLNQTKRNRNVDKDRASISENEITRVQMREREREGDVLSL